MPECKITLQFKCAKAWEQLASTDGEHRFCDECHQNVYWVETEEEASEHAQKGHCIAFTRFSHQLTGMPPPDPQEEQMFKLFRKLENLFEGELDVYEMADYVMDVIRGKMLDSTTLQQQAANNTKQQFRGSPDLIPLFEEAVTASIKLYPTLSIPALDDQIKHELIKLLLANCSLYEELRARAQAT